MNLSEKIQALSYGQKGVFLSNTDTHALKLFLDLEIEQNTMNVIEEFNSLEEEEQKATLEGMDQSLDIIKPSKNPGGEPT